MTADERPVGFSRGQIALAIAMLGCGAVIVFGYWTFRRVRASTIDKAVLCPVRQLAAAADQYFLENGVSTAAWSDLVGPDKYVKCVNTIAGETYPRFFARGMTITVSGVAGVRTVTYVPYISGRADQRCGECAPRTLSSRSHQAADAPAKKQGPSSG